MYVIYAACTFLNNLIKGGETKQKDLAQKIRNDIEEIYKEMKTLKRQLQSSEFDDTETQSELDEDEDQELKDIELETDSKC